MQCIYICAREYLYFYRNAIAIFERPLIIPEIISNDFISAITGK